MTSLAHPYANLPLHAFWKTGVADISPEEIDLGWRPKVPVDRGTRIITLGSCFAQHISRTLKENGFHWLEAEPAPSEAFPEENAKNGYGIFSFRTGNIYTAALLKQWVAWAIEPELQSTECFQQQTRYYDPFRPTIPEQGFDTPDSLLAARRNTLSSMVATIRQADLLIFTLGLTEAWLNKDGCVYPMCPGTVRGIFLPAWHVFHNYTEPEVIRDLIDVFDGLKTINPRLRFLLTVSPVPLTATVSGQHILTAAIYSKSVLRSAAGHLAQTRADVDYFPSYELITGHPFMGRFFERNQRTVTPAGVSFVMSQFFRGIEPLDEATNGRSSTPPRTPKDTTHRQRQKFATISSSKVGAGYRVARQPNSPIFY